MKTLSRIILIITALISLNACTHNNGDIGHLFGTWKLNEITANGELDSVYAEADNVLWKFQSSVMSMIRANDVTHSRFESWASWEYTDNETRIALNFTNTDDNNTNPGASIYSPLPEMHMPKACIVYVDIITLSHKEMVLRYTSEDGVEYIYRFKRWA
ncbi:MAG: lipocalin-like domain-containing protein [Muribaculaceae bacterium]|nr:lipocalin-like domain-containing protein [Muribaculaceae bacterium]